MDYEKHGSIGWQDVSWQQGISRWVGKGEGEKGLVSKGATQGKD